MVQSFKKALHKRSEKNQQALLNRLEGELDGIYDLIHQVFAEESTSLQVLQSTLRKAMRRSSKENYEKYLRLWIFRLTVESIQRRYPRFLSERLEDQNISFDYLSLEEKLVLFLHDRTKLQYEEIAAVMQIPVGRVGRSLTYAREKVAKELDVSWAEETTQTLIQRVNLNRAFDHQGSVAADNRNYLNMVAKVRDQVCEIPGKRFSEIERSIRVNQILPILGRSDVVGWTELPWQYKLGLEASVLGLVGLLAVVVMPWAFSKINATAMVEGRFAEVFQMNQSAMSAPELEEVTADRVLASSEGADAEALQEPDEFANTEFPSGDSYEGGAAPAAPSKQQAAVYRLIVQSPSPKELIPYVRTLFAQQEVKEKNSSGRVMPGGVYFDGITTVAAYPQILSEMQKTGLTFKTYSNPTNKNHPNERARVIVWVQQI